MRSALVRRATEADGNAPERNKHIHRTARRITPRFVINDVLVHEHLSNFVTVKRKIAVIYVNKLTLSDCGASLLFDRCEQLSGEAQLREPASDRTG